MKIKLKDSSEVIELLDDRIVDILDNGKDIKIVSYLVDEDLEQYYIGTIINDKKQSKSFNKVKKPKEEFKPKYDNLKFVEIDFSNVKKSINDVCRLAKISKDSFDYDSSSSQLLLWDEIVDWDDGIVIFKNHGLYSERVRILNKYVFYEFFE